MDFFDFFYTKINQQLKSFASANNVNLPENYTKFTIELPKNKHHGDIATNLAMIISKGLNQKPQDFFEKFLPYLKNIEELDKIDFVLPGFINFTIKRNFWYKSLSLALTQKDSSFSKNNIMVNVEFVSANPTGPLHIGNARGAVIGDILANLYSFCGYTVVKEYYVNDAGNQIDSLLTSVYIKYLELQNIAHTLGIGEYPGEYIEELAKEILNKHHKMFNNMAPIEWKLALRPICINYVMSLIKSSLLSLRVSHDIFSSEAAIATQEEYQSLVKGLEQQDLVYMGTLNPPKGMVVEDFEVREQKLFKSTLFGDDIDRALEKSNGDLTYFAGDAVYHKNKIDREFKKLIVILGSDHIGYGTRISAFVKAYSNNLVNIDVVYTQMVNIIKDGKPVRMSKRAGNFILLKDAIDNLGADIIRFNMLLRKSDVELDFDLDKAVADNMDNPIFYINYAYARINSIIKKFNEEYPDIKLLEVDLNILSELNTEIEVNIMKLIAKFNKVIKTTLSTNDLYKLYLYLMELSEALHYYWNCGKEDSTMRFINKDNQNLTISRVLLLKALADKIKTVMSILNINIKEQM